MGEAQKMAEAGMALFAKEGAEDVEVDTAAAAAFKTEHERAIEEKSELEKSLTGKDNKKQRTAVAKEIKDLKNDPKYIDACKIAKGMDPPKGNFIVKKSGGKRPSGGQRRGGGRHEEGGRGGQEGKGRQETKEGGVRWHQQSRARRARVAQATNHQKEGRTQRAGPIWWPVQQGSRSRYHGR